MKQLNWYQIFGNVHTIPDGRTVTPTDDVQILLHCANIWDKDYTTLAEVLADDDTLFLICISDNAIDYLVRSTTWASSTELIPIMTSNTTPSGEAFAYGTRSGYYAYHAFDRDSSTNWSGGSANSYIGYHFASRNKYEKFSLKYIQYNYSSITFEVQGSNDGISYSTVDTITLSNSTSDTSVQTYEKGLDISDYEYVRLFFAQNPFASGGSFVLITDIQFNTPSIVDSESAMQYIGASDYASETLLDDSTWNVAVAESPYYEYVLDVKNPKMTGYTTPKGEVFQSSVNGSRYGWYAFDDTLANFWASTSPTNSYIGYRFTQPFRLRTVRIAGGQPDVPTQSPKNIIVQGSSDGITYNDVQSIVTSRYSDEKFAIINNSEVSYWRLFCTDNYGAPTATAIREINFYGREIGGVQSWLKAGGITNKKYTTVSEVLSDLTTLATLMASSDAVDYLVTAKGWATEICSDSNAMADIGMNNYAANTLLADSVWCEAILNSTYIDSVMNVKNPDMTSATTPYGVVSADTYISTYYPWLTFDGDTVIGWATGWGGTYSTGNWIKYEFPSAVKIYGLKYYHKNPDGTTAYNVNLEGSNDNSTYVNVMTFKETIDNQYHAVAFDNPGSYKWYRWTYTGPTVSNLNDVKFYGRKDI